MIFLKVPFSEKDKAKALGARWNSERKAWYVPDGKDITPFKQWHDPNQINSAIGTSKNSVKLPPSSIETNSGVTQAGKYFLDLNHDCDPFFECLECKPVLQRSGWIVSANVLN